MMKWPGVLVSLFLLISTWIAGQPAMAAGPAQAASLAMAGTVVLTQGDVAVRRGGMEHWEPAQPAQKLHEGDAVRTGPGARCAIMCADESQIKLNEKTMLILKNVAPSPRLQPKEIAPAAPKAPPTSIYQVPNGEIWLRNKREKFNFELETPAVTATIRGTEINIQVKPDGATRVVLLEGAICLVNAYGDICLRPGEQGFVLPGQAPTKQMLVQPADAVQWSLYYPGIFSFRDLPLAPQAGQTRAHVGPAALAALIQQGESAYDQGRLSEAQQAGESVLAKEPDNPRALTLLGWLALQKHDPDAALGYFSRVRQTDEMATIGLALSRYRLGQVAGAYEAMQAAHRLPPNPSLVAMTGFFAVLAGRVDEARSAMEAAVRQYPGVVLPRTLLAQIYLVQNRKEAARKEAAAALSTNPNSPLALLTTGLIKMTFFQPTEAAQYFDKAIITDPRFVDAYVYLARIWLASEYLDRARATIDQALRLAPKDGAVLSLAGFVRLAFRDYQGAKTYWDQAVKSNVRLGEPHLGLAIYQFRYRHFEQGLEEMLTATLLEPRVSRYQNELGKALYQTKSFDRALEIWDYAGTLDPKDPTPHLYKGIALTDLNRPGEAIQEINKSIELNDNVAVFRARQSLDQDLAVRNAGLAVAYQQLGMTDWAFSKAITAVKYEPFNSAAHLFLRDAMIAGRAGFPQSFFTAGLLFATAETEGALYRVLSPANQATFRNLPLRGTEDLGLTRDYAPMFEMPYARLAVSGGIGASEGSKSRQHHQAGAYGGIPGAAFETFGEFVDDRGLPRPSDASLQSFNGTLRLYNVEAAAKWEPTVKGTITGLFQYADQKTTDQGVTSGIPSFGFSDNTKARLRVYELAYYHRFNPQAAILAYFTHKELPFHLASQFSDVPVSFEVLTGQTFDQEISNIQLQKHLTVSVWGKHNLIGGFDYFSSNISQRFRQDLAGVGTLFQGDFRPPFWSHSFYLLDYWRVRQNLLVELGLFKTFQKDPRFNFVGTIYTSMWSPRFGVNYQFGVGSTQHVLRAAMERHLTTHLIGQPLLVSSDIAGFPWAIDASSGSEVRQAGIAWETQWDAKTFTTLRLNALRVATPTFATDVLGIEHPVSQNWKRYQGSLALNRILTTSFGLSLGLVGKRVIPDLSFGPDLQSYSELNAFLNLAYLNRRGWLARITPLLVQQFGKVPQHEADNPFVILNLTLGREFPNKRGFALFEVQNLFNRQPFYSLEPLRDIEFPTTRRFMFRVGLYF